MQSFVRARGSAPGCRSSELDFSLPDTKVACSYNDSMSALITSHVSRGSKAAIAKSRLQEVVSQDSARQGPSRSSQLRQGQAPKALEKEEACLLEQPNYLVEMAGANKG